MERLYVVAPFGGMRLDPARMGQVFLRIDDTDSDGKRVCASILLDPGQVRTVATFLANIAAQEDE